MTLTINAVQGEVVSLLFLLRIVILGFLSAMLTQFIKMCLSERMIFWRYYLLLTAIYIKSWRRKNRWKRYILKPLGMCHYCYGTWIAMFTYIYFIGLDFAIFIIFGVNYLSTVLFDRFLYKDEIIVEEKIKEVKGFMK